MKILMLTGSPRKNGNSSMLADAFIKGAEAAGHDIVRFDTAMLNIGACTACDYCRQEGNDTCAFDDDMQQIYPHLLAADMVVFATPLYYFDMSAQIKAAIDRFYAHNLKIRGKKAALLMACGDSDDWAKDAIALHFKTICRYCQWQDMGMVLALGKHAKGTVAGSQYLIEAEDLGRSL